MNTATAYARRARAARTAVEDLLYPTALPVQPYTRHDDERAARLADYADRCSNLADAAAGSRTIGPALRAMNDAEGARAAWITIRHDRERRAGLRRIRGGAVTPTADQVPMHLQ